MPIQFKCGQCQHALTVPDNLAGKQGKCPKCQQVLKVPAGTSNPKPAGVSNAKPARAAAAAPAPVNPLMESLLKDAGVGQKKGPACPNCQAPIKPGVVVCVACGFNFQTNQQLKGFNAKSEKPEFENEHLNVAVSNMNRDLALESRISRASMPWWVLASILLGGIILCAAGVILVDGNFGTPNPPETRLGKLQRLPAMVVLGSTIGIVGVSLAVFAHLSICIYAFQQKKLLGFICFFLPFLASLPFGIKSWQENRAPVKGAILAFVISGIGLAMIMGGGGFSTMKSLFE